MASDALARISFDASGTRFSVQGVDEEVEGAGIDQRVVVQHEHVLRLALQCRRETRVVASGVAEVLSDSKHAHAGLVAPLVPKCPSG